MRRHYAFSGWLTDELVDLIRCTLLMNMSRMDRQGRRVHVDWEPCIQEVLTCMALTSRIALSIHLVCWFATTAMHFQITWQQPTRGCDELQLNLQ